MKGILFYFIYYYFFLTRNVNEIHWTKKKFDITNVLGRRKNNIFLYKLLINRVELQTANYRRLTCQKMENIFFHWSPYLYMTSYMTNLFYRWEDKSGDSNIYQFLLLLYFCILLFFLLFKKKFIYFVKKFFPRLVELDSENRPETEFSHPLTSCQTARRPMPTVERATTCGDGVQPGAPFDKPSVVTPQGGRVTRIGRRSYCNSLHSVDKKNL